MKKYWLCPKCEDLFGGWEADFANKLFHPLTSGKAHQFEYDEWLLKFAVSLSWRVLLHLSGKNAAADFPERHREEIERALSTWSQFMLGVAANPGKYQQHILLLDEIADHTISDLPTNINRYLLRSIDMDVWYSERHAFVYTKLPQVMFIGFVNMDVPGAWEGTLIEAGHGLVGRPQYCVPKYLLDYIKFRAQNAQRVLETISEPQQKKIGDTFRKNMDRLARSKTFQALQADVRLFGREAFKGNSDREDKE